LAGVDWALWGAGECCDFDGREVRSPRHADHDCGVAAALWNLAAPSPAAAVRWQSVRVLQIAHALWPPLLFYFLWKKIRAEAIDAVGNLLALADSG
jgi:hypothetical protein